MVHATRKRQKSVSQEKVSFHTLCEISVHLFIIIVLTDHILQNNMQLSLFNDYPLVLVCTIKVPWRLCLQQGFFVPERKGVVRPPRVYRFKAWNKDDVHISIIIVLTDHILQNNLHLWLFNVCITVGFCFNIKYI